MIEKAFAVRAAPDAIWRALLADLESGDRSAYEIEDSKPNERLVLWVNLEGGGPARLTYRLVPRDDHTEVVATMEPQGLRYAFARILSFGRVNTNYELVLVQGLSNLKQAAESP